MAQVLALREKGWPRRRAEPSRQQPPSGCQARAQRPEALANAAHGAWNCGRPKAASDLADLVESFGGADMMDVIRVGQNNARGASQGVAAGQGAAKDFSE